MDVFSFTSNDPFRISFFGNEIEKINLFDCNTQLSKEERESADIFPDMIAEENVDGGSMKITEIFPENTVVWMDSPDSYKSCDFYRETERFKRVFLDVPLDLKKEKLSSSISSRSRYSTKISSCFPQISASVLKGVIR